MRYVSRPLPENAMFHAQDATHYLLYLYDVMRNHLIEIANDSLLKVFNRSTEICKKVSDVLYIW